MEEGGNQHRENINERSESLDMSGHVETGLDNTRFSLSVEEVSAKFSEAGVPRSPRTIARFCQQGHLDYIRVETEKNFKFLVDPGSVEKRIKELQQAFFVTSKEDEVSRHIEPPVVTSHDMSGQQNGQTERKTTEHIFSIPTASREIELYEKIVSQIEKENNGLRADKEMLLEQLKIKDTQMEAKDRQLELVFSSERDTKTLAKSFQNLIAYVIPGAKRERPDETLPRAYGPLVEDVPPQPGEVR